MTNEIKKVVISEGLTKREIVVHSVVDGVKASNTQHEVKNNIGEWVYLPRVNRKNVRNSNKGR